VFKLFGEVLIQNRVELGSGRTPGCIAPLGQVDLINRLTVYVKYFCILLLTQIFVRESI
jgi:hypothetical protein